MRRRICCDQLRGTLGRICGPADTVQTAVPRSILGRHRLHLALELIILGLKRLQLGLRSTLFDAHLRVEGLHSDMGV